MKKSLAVHAFVLSLLIFLGMPVGNSHAVMPLPAGSGIYLYSSIENPVLSDDPSLAKPVSVGLVASGGETLSMLISLPEITGAVDLYFGLYLPIFDPINVYILDKNNAFQLVSQGLVPFRQNVEGPIDEALFGDLPIQDLPKGTYQVYFVVTPAGSLQSYYLWQTSFFVGGWSITEVEAPILSAFGERGAFGALLDAFNKGYSLEQIVEGSVTGRLQANGDVYQYGSSSVEAPHNPPLDFLVSSDLKKMGELHIQGTLKKDELYNKFKNASAGEMNALTVLLELNFRCQYPDEDEHGDKPSYEECFAEGLTKFIEILTPEDCTTNCIPCLKLSDGTKMCPSEKGIIDFSKSFSGLGVTVTGPSSLKEGEAGTWTAAAVNGVEPFTFYSYWGDGRWSESTAGAAQHSYSKGGNYNVVVRVEEKGSEKDALSSAIPVEVSEGPALPYKQCVVTFDVEVVMKDGDAIEHIVNRLMPYWGPGTFTGIIFNGDIDASIGCTGDFHFTVTSSENVYYWKSFQGNAMCGQDPNNITAGSNKAMVLTEYTDGNGDHLGGRVDGTEACQFIDSFYWKWTFLGYEYVRHYCDEGSSLSVRCDIK